MFQIHCAASNVELVDTVPFYPVLYDWVQGVLP